MATVYGETAPEIEIRNGMAFVGPTASGDTIVYSVALFRETFHRMELVLDRFDREQAGKVVSLRASG